MKEIKLEVRKTLELIMNNKTFLDHAVQNS